MTLRTRTASTEAKFSLVFFEVDETYSIVEACKLQTLIPGELKVQGIKLMLRAVGMSFRRRLWG